MAEFGPVKQWLHTVTQRMGSIFLASNLYNALPILYGDLAVFGTAAISVLDDEKEIVRAYPHPIGSFALGLDKRQTVKTCVREYMMTVRQVVDEFARQPNSTNLDWTNISQSTKNLWDRGQYEDTVPIAWIVAPNPDHDPHKLESRFLPYYSCHFEKGGESKKLLQEKGYHEFPVLAPRWDVTGEDTYSSSCPGMDALCDVKALQIMQRRKAQAIEIGINPSLQAPTSLRNQKISLLPADVTFVDMLQQQTASIRPIREVNLQALQWFTTDIRETQQRVSKAFFEDLFLMLVNSEQSSMTAREVSERHEEKLLALGPVLERLNDELFDPLMDRVYNLMDRAGIIPQPPQELEGVDLKVEYVSLIASSQKIVGAMGLDRFVQSTVPLMQASPQVMHKINFSQIVDDYGEMLGINPKIIVPDDEAEQAMQAQMQQIQQQRQMQMGLEGSKAAKNLSGANLGDESDNALKRILEMQGAPS